MNKILDDLKLGLLNDYELSWLMNHVEMEKERREQEPAEYIDVIRCKDGSEGFYVKKEDFHKIPAEDLKDYIAQTIAYGGDIGFSMDKYDKKEYAKSCARYEWQFGDESNTEVPDDEDEDLDNEDEDDIENFKNK